ncbi:hypothetical protein [Fervidibacillus halotolerans]|uniref:Uncharacterized protein n=1 Tax=Fervidibacillus halotolerans TaxID=2980027 RepID=A0A9E8RZB6_9BACI|nr:hypothetical protein [Fervidibacillus halotolerans]WAA13756.1 hypothetical protein OE105_06550 [Fervidibacillus halotolerans]
MTYIIENANVLKNNELIRTSLLVNGEKITSVQPSFSKYRYIRMDLKEFIMTPTYVFLLHQLPNQKDGYSKKNDLLQRFLLKGCTTVIAVEKVMYLNELLEKRESIRRFFHHTPMDYVAAVRIPIRLLTVPFIQTCKREKIPAIFVEFQDKRDLYKIPWGWIREALFPYNCPLIPAPAKDEPKLLETWQFVMEKEKIPHITEPLKEGEPIPIDVLKKIGIYPLKGYLQTGGELSYNLFLTDDNQWIVEKGKPITLERSNLVITVHKGEIIRVKNTFFYNPNKGEEIIIHRPSFFQS